MEIKRIPCPYCQEMIIPGAKKCRFCKENLESIKYPRLKLPYLLWLISIAIFFICLFFIRRINDSTNTWIIILIILSLSVISGTIAYLVLIVKIFNSIKKRTAQLYGIYSIITFFVFFVLFFNYSKIEEKLGFQPIIQNQRNSVTTSTPTPSLSPSPTLTNKPIQQKIAPPKMNTTNKIICTGPDGKTFETTQEECSAFNRAWGNIPSPDPNEYIRCDIHPNCGGGYKEMTRASCERITCCYINKTWELRDKDQCSREQKQEAEAARIQFCNNLYNPDSCSIYWNNGTLEWYDCRFKAFKDRSECYAR